MVQIRNSDIDAWLSRPDPKATGVLVYGPDRGLVSERAIHFAKSCGMPLDDPFSVIRLEAADLDDDPGRLEDELRTISMFSSRRLVWVRNASAQKVLAEAFRQLDAQAAILLVEAGDLKKTSPLRQAAETAASGFALPCYADDARSLDHLIDAEFSAAGKTLSLDARVALKLRLGGDRLASRGEIAKLILYAGQTRHIEAADVTEAIGDVSAVTIDAAADAVLASDRKALDQAMARAFMAGTPPFLMLSGMLRQLHLLQVMRAEADKTGKSCAAVVAGSKPPVFFSRRPLIEKALANWPAAALSRAARHIQDTILRTRQTPELAEALTRQALLALSARPGRN
ncbi:MAG: DNA polymerase III subunit delta [Rhizobiaceae bacterium]